MAVSFSPPPVGELEQELPSEYLCCASTPALKVRMHMDAIDGIARDVAEGVKSLPRRGAEIGGLLMGESIMEKGSAVTRIESYHRVDCEHRFGPQFRLSESELESLGHADGQSGVIGFYRSNTRAEFGVEPSDDEIASRYFPDPGDIILLIQPTDTRDIDAQFYVRNTAGAFERVGDVFSFRGKVVDTSEMVEAIEAEPEQELRTAEKPRRLVPDFQPPVESPRPVAAEPMPATPLQEYLPNRAPEPVEPAKRRWWPLLSAMALVGTAVFFVIQSQPGDKQPGAAPALVDAAAPVRPLGLYVDAGADSLRVSWNSAATALQGARNVALFVREGEDQNRIDLSPQDLQSGTYQYKPAIASGKDITFRLEAADAAGHVSAESFRMVQVPAVVAAAPVAVTAPVKPAPAAVHVRAIRKVAPVVPASIRPRIHAPIAIDVRVRIDNKGRVTTAQPVAHPRAGLQQFLADRAIVAAKQWKFEAHEATEVIHFVFEH